MRSLAQPIACALVLVCTGACVPEDTGHVTAHVAVSLQSPYSDLPPAPPGTSIEAGTRVPLDARQQEAVVAGVAKWMKDPRSAQFGTMEGARNSRGLVTVCGSVSGRNGGGTPVGMAPYIGVLMGTRASPDFVVVGIAGSARERAGVASLCRESGIAQAG